MAMTRAQMMALIGDRVPDQSRLAAGAAGRALDQAVARYTLDQPQRRAVDLTVTAEQTVPVPTDLLVVLGLEESTWGASLYYRLRQRPEGPVLAVAAKAGTAVTLLYGAAHVCTDASVTIPPPLQAPVAALAAALLLDQLSAAAAGDSDSTLPADTVDRRGAAERYASAARAARRVYDDALAATGTEAGQPPPAVAHAALRRHRRLVGGDR